jgi:hypothetical protein
MEKCHARSSGTKRCFALCRVFVQSLHPRPRPQRSEIGRWHTANACQAEDLTTLGSRSLSCDHMRMRPHISAPRHEQTPNETGRASCARRARLANARQSHLALDLLLPLCPWRSSIFDSCFFLVLGAFVATHSLVRRRAEAPLACRCDFADLASTLPDVPRAPV